MWRKPARSRGPEVFLAAPGVPAKPRTGNRACRGWTLVELMVMCLVLGLILRMSLPLAQNMILTYRLSAAAASASSAIQQTRYRAIQVGCSYTIAFTSGTSTYQVQTQAISGTPPVCASSYSNVGSATYWTSGGGISISTSPVFTFSPGGITTATVGAANCTMPCSFQISNTSGSTRTIVVSGVGYVKVTTP